MTFGIILVLSEAITIEFSNLEIEDAPRSSIVKNIKVLSRVT